MVAIGCVTYKQNMSILDLEKHQRPWNWEKHLQLRIIFTRFSGVIHMCEQGQPKTKDLWSPKIHDFFNSPTFPVFIWILLFTLQALGCETHFSPVRCDELHASLADCEELRTQELRQAQHDAELAQRKRQQLLLALEVGQKCPKINVNSCELMAQLVTDFAKKNEGWQSN